MDVKIIQRNTGRFFVLATAVLGMICRIAYGQQLPVISYDSSNGLMQPAVWSIFQDSRSFMWFGTSEGLTRWDGENFLNFALPDGLPELTIRTISEDQKENLWIGTDFGIARYDGRKFFTFPETQEGYGIVWAVTKDHSGRLWFGTEKRGVLLWTGSEFISFTTADGLTSDYVYSLMVDSADHLWIGHRGHGITRCQISASSSLEDCHTISVNDGLGHNIVRTFDEDKSGNIWIGTRGGGLLRFSNGSLTRFGTENGLASDDVYALKVSVDGQLIIGTARHGVSICDIPDITNCRSYSMTNGLADTAVLTITEDQNQTIWVGFSGGASQITSPHVVTYGLRDGLPHDTVYSILPADNSSVWAGTLDGLALINNQKTAAITAWQSSGQFPGHEIWEMVLDFRGSLWLATEGGLCRFSGGTCTDVLTSKEGLADTDLYTVYAARDQSLWIGTINGASQLTISSTGKFSKIRNFGLNDGLTGPYVLSIAEDHEGHIWLGTDKGLNRWDGTELLSFTQQNGLPGIGVADITSTTSGQIYLTVEDAGLVEIITNPGYPVDPPTFSAIGIRDGLPDDISVIMENDDHNLWLGTENGIFIYDPSTHQVVDHIAVSSGLPSREINALAQDPSGSVWVATSVGLTRIDKGRTSMKLRPPIVNIDSIRLANGMEWRSRFTPPSVNRNPEVKWLDTTPIRLDHDFAFLRFDFHALPFGSLENRFLVYLEGFDEAWSEPMKARFKEYTNLNPGEYSFHVKAEMKHGQRGESVTIPFTVVAAWWQTTWARVSFVLFLITFVVSGVRLRTRSIRNRALQLERAVSDRTDDLRRYARAMEDHSLALDRANVQIIEADRVKTKFLANMSHELRTPLNSIIGFSEILSSKLKDRIDIKEMKFLRNVSRSGRYLLLLINNLLDLSKIEADQMDVRIEKIELPILIKDTLKIVQGYAADRKINVELHLEPDIGEVDVDIPKFNQILINLLSNAVKFSSPGDTVCVGLHRLSRNVSPLNLDSYELSVTDHGPGIPEEDHNIIFGEFQQAGQVTNHPSGTGLGLALVRRFVALLGGAVSFESVPGNTTFRVVLPSHLSGAINALPATTSETDKYPIFRRPCVLVLDRDRTHFQRLAIRLEAHGLLPVRAGDADEAQRMNDALRPAALIILWDIAGARQWQNLVKLVTFPDPLPVVIAAQFEEIGDISLAADACISCPATVDDFSEFSKTFAPGGRLKIMLRCAQTTSCAHLKSILDQCEIEHEILTDAAHDEKPDLLVLNLGVRPDHAALSEATQLFPNTISLFVMPTADLSCMSALKETSEELITSIAQQVQTLVHRRGDRRKKPSPSA